MELINPLVFVSQIAAVLLLLCGIGLIALRAHVSGRKSALIPYSCMAIGLSGFMIYWFVRMDLDLCSDERDWKLYHEGTRVDATILEAKWPITTRYGTRWQLKCRYRCSDGDVREANTELVLREHQPTGEFPLVYMANDHSWCKPLGALRTTAPDRESQTATWFPWLIVVVASGLGLYLSIDNRKHNAKTRSAVQTMIENAKKKGEQ